MILKQKISKLQQTSSRVRKAEMVNDWRTDEVFCLYLKAAFSPYITFNVSKESFRGIQPGHYDDWLQPDWIMMNELVAHPESFSRVKLRNWLTQFEPDFQSMMIGMLTKTPRLGISGDTILGIIPSLWEEFKVPLAYPVDWAKVIYPCYGQAKIDGLRCIYKDRVFRTRKGHVIYGLNSIYESLKACHIDDKELDGEIYVQGESFDEISGKIRSFENTPDAHYYIFDVHLPQVDYTTRHNALATTARLMWVPNKITNLSVPMTKVLNNYQEAMEFYDQCRNWGFEGILLKDMEATRFTGRKRLWQKVKPVETIDITVTGIDEGDGRNEGKVGALICDMNGVEVRVGTGLSDAQREVWFATPEVIIGKTIEIAYMEKSSKGKTRHPRLIQVRGDK